MIYPSKFVVYKKNSAVQFQLQPFHLTNGKLRDFEGRLDEGSDPGFAFTKDEEGRVRLKDGWSEREGAIFMDMAPAKGERVYDWDQKIVFALSVTDASKLLYAIEAGVEVVDKSSIFHDPGAGTDRKGQVSKSLSMTSPKGYLAPGGGCLLNLKQKAGEKTLSHSVGLLPSEVVALRELLRSSIPQMLGWK